MRGRAEPAAAPGRRGPLLAYRSGPRWHDVTAADINDYLREVSGGEYTAKDFRTWHATVLAAVGLAVSEGASGSDAARKRAIARVVREVADYLGNTPAVARACLYRSALTGGLLLIWLRPSGFVVVPLGTLLSAPSEREPPVLSVRAKPGSLSIGGPAPGSGLG